MPVLTIKGIPDGLYERLKRRAALHRRSLNRMMNCGAGWPSRGQNAHERTRTPWEDAYRVTRPDTWTV
jgi:hypothetical protein